MNAINKKPRNSSIELLRILAIIMVIANHFCTHGIIIPQKAFSNDQATWQVILAFIISYGGDLANNLFILITGYYMASVKKQNYKRMLRLLFDMCLYSWIIMLVFYLLHLRAFDKDYFIRGLFPFWRGLNWFVCCYLVLLFFVPYINTMISGLQQKDFLIMILLIALFKCVLPLWDFNTYMGSTKELSQFIFMYLTGSYIRLWTDVSQLRQKANLLAAVTVLSVLCLLLLTLERSYFSIHGNGFSNVGIKHYGGFFQPLIAVELLLLFLSFREFHSRFINTIAKSVLGIYLIHDNPLVRDMIWLKLLPNLDYLYRSWFPLFLIGKVLAVFLICLAIDQIKVHTLDPLFDRLINSRKL
jgi:surface polysaccharide O-acyltransferase-like enzyme